MGNIKTTISGLLSGIFPLLSQVFPKYSSVFDALGKLAIAALGFFAADASAKS